LLFQLRPVPIFTVGFSSGHPIFFEPFPNSCCFFSVPPPPPHPPTLWDFFLPNLSISGTTFPHHKSILSAFCPRTVVFALFETLFQRPSTISARLGHFTPYGTFGIAPFIIPSSPITASTQRTAAAGPLHEKNPLIQSVEIFLAHLFPFFASADFN